MAATQSYYDSCTECPYFEQKHLPKNEKTTRQSPPIDLENNTSKTLLVFQAPGTNEWLNGQAIFPADNNWRTAANRIKSTMKAAKVLRKNFDIVNAVQCFPGKGKSRDKKPRVKPLELCQELLFDIISNANYSVVVSFGEVANKAVSAVIDKQARNHKPTHKNLKHPCGGIKNSELIDLWKELI